MLFLFVSFLMCTVVCNSQNNEQLDSLSNWTYERLFEKHLQSKTPEEALIYAHGYLNKAKKEKDTVRISYAFTQIISESNFEMAINYCDSLIHLTKIKPTKEFPSWAYLNKGILLFKFGHYEKSLDNYSKAYIHALEKKNDFHLYLINDQIGQLKIFWGSSEDAIGIFRQQLLTLKNLEVSNNPAYGLDALHNLTNAFIIDKKIDSAYKYNLIGLKNSLKFPKTQYYPYFLKQSGEIQFYKNNFQVARDSLLKALTKNPQFTLENTFTILGQIERDLSNRKKAFYYFKKADSIVELTQDYTPETKVIHSFLRDYYFENGDLKNREIYTLKLEKTDSIIAENYKNVNRKLIEDFEIPKIISEKDQTIELLKIYSSRKDRVLKNLMFGLSSLILGFIFYGIRKKIKKKEKPNPLKGLSQEVIDSLTKQLERFEKNKRYKSNKVDLKTLSKRFKTNSAYLSKVVNGVKDKNFSTYLNDLRMENCINELNSNKKYHNYDMNSLAVEFGFNNAQSFTNAFSEKLGITPGAYIKKLKRS